MLFPDVTFELRMILTGATIVFYAGYIDDMFSLSPFGRLAAHFAAALRCRTEDGKPKLLFRYRL